MIIATLRVKVPADQRKIFLDSARSVTGRTSVQPGCISCKFYQDIDEPDNMLFMEEWSSREEYEHHIRSDTFRIILSLIDLSDEAPLIKLNTISKTEGLETIEAVRTGQRI